MVRSVEEHTENKMKEQCRREIQGLQLWGPPASRGTYTEVEGKAIGANALADASRVAARSIFAMVGYEREKWRKVHEVSIARLLHSAMRRRDSHKLQD